MGLLPSASIRQVSSFHAGVVRGTASLSTPATANSVVGPYTITATQGTLSAANYTFVFVNGSLTVTPAALLITANNASKTYGQTATFAATAFTATGLVNGDTVSGVTLSSAGAAASAGAGSYAIAPSAAVGTGLSNYTITYANGALTVNTASLTVTAGAQSKTYGTTANLGSTAFTTSGLVNGDTVTGVTLTSAGAAATAAVGAYPITPSAITRISGNSCLPPRPRSRSTACKAFSP